MGGFALRRDQQDHRATVLLDQPVGDNTDHAAVPLRMRQHNHAAVEQRRILRDLRLRGVVDLLDQQPSLDIERFQPRRQHARPLDVASGQQFDGKLGVVQSAERVQAWRQRKADGFFGDLRRIDLRQCDQGLQAEPLGVPQRIQPALKQIAGVAALLRDVGDDAQCYQIEQLRCVAAQRRDQLIGDADAGQVAQGMTLGEPLRVDDGVSVRQFRRQGVMIGDHDVDSLRVGVVNRLVLADAGVAGED